MALGNFMMDITIAKQFPDPISRDASLGELIQRLDAVSGVFKSQENRPYYKGAPLRTSSMSPTRGRSVERATSVMTNSSKMTNRTS